MMRSSTWLLGALIVSLVVAIVLSALKINAAERVALVEQARADAYAAQIAERDVAEAVLIAANDALEDSLAVLKDSVNATLVTMGRANRAAIVRTDSLNARVEEVAGDSVATIAWADSLNTAYEERTYALAAQLSVALTYMARDSVWHTQDREAKYEHAQTDALLRLQVAALESTVDAWQAVARPGIILQIKQNLGLVGVSVGVGGVLCMALCR